MEIVFSLNYTFNDNIDYKTSKTELQSKNICQKGEEIFLVRKLNSELGILAR